VRGTVGLGIWRSGKSAVSELAACLLELGAERRRRFHARLVAVVPERKWCVPLNPHMLAFLYHIANRPLKDGTYDDMCLVA